MVHGKAMACVLVATVALTAAACAQSPGGPPGTRGGTARDGIRPEAPRSMSAADTPLNPGAVVLVQLDRLEDDLKLAPAQRSAWVAYARKVQQLADETARVRFDARTSERVDAGAPQQLEQLARGMRARTATVDEIVELGNALHASLTPEQRAIADRRLALGVTLLVTGVAPPGMTGTPEGRPQERAP